MRNRPLLGRVPVPLNERYRVYCAHCWTSILWPSAEVCRALPARQRKKLTPPDPFTCSDECAQLYATIGGLLTCWNPDCKKQYGYKQHPHPFFCSDACESHLAHAAIEFNREMARRWRVAEAAERAAALQRSQRYEELRLIERRHIQEMSDQLRLEAPGDEGVAVIPKPYETESRDVRAG